MFLMIGVSTGSRDIAHNQMVICAHCGAYGRYQVFMTYTCLSLFFIPVLKWNRRYYVRTSCCGTVYELDPALGAQIASGRDAEILDDDLIEVKSGRGRYRRCSCCGYSTNEDFDYCPKCGQKF